MFSIIMPVYNSILTLDMAINSILAQTRGDFELIIVDDGSTDGSYDRCVFFSMQDSRIRVYKNPHGGVSAARNRGIDEAKGDIVLFIDSDDFWKPNLLENANEISSGVYTLFGFYTNYFDVDGNKQTTVEEFTKAGTKIYSLKELSVDELLNYNIAAPWNKYFERKIIMEHNIRFHTECVYLEDLAFNLEYLKHCTSVKVLFDNLYNYRINVGKRQILKRTFTQPFSNADVLFVTAKDFLFAIGKSFDDTLALTGTVCGAYCREALAWIYEKNHATTKKYLNQLNHNENFLEILDCGGGRFVWLLKFAVKHNLLFVEEKILKKRYW